MKITIDKDKCIGCGLCEAVASEIFIVKDGVAELVPNADLTNEDNKKNAKSAAEMCSQEAIIISEEE